MSKLCALIPSRASDIVIRDPKYSWLGSNLGPRAHANRSEAPSAKVGGISRAFFPKINFSLRKTRRYLFPPITYEPLTRSPGGMSLIGTEFIWLSCCWSRWNLSPTPSELKTNRSWTVRDPERHTRSNKRIGMRCLVFTLFRIVSGQ